MKHTKHIARAPSPRIGIFATLGARLGASGTPAFSLTRRRTLLLDAKRVPRRLRTFVRAAYVRSPGPFPKSLVPRRSYWRLADQLIAAARGGGRRGPR